MAGLGTHETRIRINSTASTIRHRHLLVHLVRAWMMLVVHHGRVVLEACRSTASPVLPSTAAARGRLTR